MNFDELDAALEELESRLERLRALYEQYFLGFEKIEPQVPRKDVDRRIYLLRREKIRNTGKRFKLQTLIQRYNTYQQYWQRVCREIENGTYRRHLLRAERMMNPDKQLTISTKRRFGRALALEQQAAAEANGAPASAPPEPALPAAAPAGVRPTAPVSPAPPSFESLELDMGFLGSWVPPAPQAPVVKVPGKLAPPPKPGSSARAVPPPKPAALPKPSSSPKAAPPPKPASSPKAAPPPKPTSSGKAAALPKPRSSPRAAPPPPSQSSPKAAPPPRPGSAKPPAKPAAPAAVAARSIADERVKELHQKLMDLKKQNKETGQVSLEGLAKTLRDTENKLREQHKIRKIDFDVVIRDGKAIVKPTVR